MSSVDRWDGADERLFPLYSDGFFGMVFSVS